MWKKFTIRTVAFLLILLSLIMILVWVVDPFDIFNSPKISHFNENKPKVGRHSRVHKACVLQESKPKIIFMGSSRTEYGIDPDNRNFGTERVYNCAISAGVPVEYEYYADLAMKNGVEHIIIGTDLFAFYSKDLLHAGFDTEVFNGPIPLRYFLSMDAFQSALKTIGSSKSTSFLKTGQADSRVLQEELDDVGSYRQSFLNNEKHYVSGNYGGGFSKTKAEHWEAFERILDKAHRRNVKVTLFISPSHARQWEALSLAQGEEIFEEFKRKLVSVNEKTALRNKKHPFELWDFTGYGILTAENVPVDSSGTMKWYWDSSHYKKELGDIVLDRMFEGNFSGGEKYPDFGVKLTEKTVEDHLKRLRADRAAWQKSHPEDVAEIKALKK